MRDAFRGRPGILAIAISRDTFFAISLLVDFLLLLLFFGGEFDTKAEFAELTGGDIEGAGGIFGDRRSEANPDGARFESIVVVEADRACDVERRIVLFRHERDSDLDRLVARLNVEADGGRLILRLGLQRHRETTLSGWMRRDSEAVALPRLYTHRQSWLLHNLWS